MTLRSDQAEVPCKKMLREVPLRFNKDGRFRIMHITDTHLSYKNAGNSACLLAKACDDEKPDIVMLTGDIACSGGLDEIRYSADVLMNVFEKRRIPVAICFGNHDSEAGIISRTELMEYFNSFSCSVSVDEGDMLTGCGTYNIPVYSSDGEKIVFNLWVFDSGSYDEQGRYSNVSADKVAWYVKESERLQNENCGEKINSMAFQHVIVPEIYDALKQVDRKGPYVYEGLYRDGRHYVLDPANTVSGIMLEGPCAGYYDHGQFDAMVSRGDVLAIFSGHDHMNTFKVKWKGIFIENTPSTRYNNDKFSTQYGYRVLDINEKDTTVFNDRVVHWYDKFSLSYARKLKKSADAHTYSAVKSVALRGKMQKISEFVSHTAAYIITGRKAVY